MKSLIEQMQILPPWNDDVKFETFITSYFNDLENTLSYDRFGRLGQKQFGLDIYSIEKKTVIQCKLKLIRGGNDERIRKELIDELDKDFNSFLAYNESNKLGYNKFIFASTFYSDTHIATECSKRSNDTITVEYWGWEKIQSNLPEKVFKTYYSEFLGFLEEFYQKDNLPYLNNTEYIQDTNTIDFILKDNHPSKNQANFVTKLMNSDRDYRRYFYTRIDNPNWFHILKNKEEFNHSNNPLPIQVNDGFQIPYWEPLTYLEKLSIHIKNGKATELIDEIINIIKVVSENPIDNYRTWYLFIRILSNFPNQNITVDILNYIPVWLGGKFDTMIQSSEVCQNLLPKFLNENPTTDDIIKAELIIKHLLTLEKGEFLKKGFTDRHESYRSRVYMHYLKDAFTEKSNLERITKYCSSDIVFQLIESIKKLRFDFPDGINIKIKTEVTEYDIKTEIVNSDLLVNLINDNQIISTTTISDFEKLDKNSIREKYGQILLGNNITFTENDDNNFNFEILINALLNGSYYTFSDSSISKLDDRYHHGESPNEVFSLILRDILNQFAKEKTDIAIAILKDISSNPKYRLPFFQRIVLYVIGENWNSLRNLFMELISESDPKKLFSDYHYQNDLYELLNKNQEHLNEEELAAIQHILEIGPQEEKEKADSYPDYWRLRWYSALRKLPQYSELYTSFSKQFGRTHDDFDHENEVRITAGDRSPMTTEEILEMSNDNIVEYIHSFKPKDRWEEPTISGFSGMLGKAIETEPLKFSEEIDVYKDVYYIYAYHIANGFRDAWKNKRSFNWDKVLHYFLKYLKDERFRNGQFSIENDGWRATSDWVIGSVANLLTEGMQSDNNAFDKELLPIAKKILQLLVEDLELKDDVKETNMDYPTYSLNSTAGKVLRACIDYALRVGRNSYPKDSSVKWDNETKEFFESAAKKNIIDSYILTGWYYQQFYFLDSDWISNKIQSYYEVEEKYWLAFIGGFTFSNPPFNNTVYKLFYPHYERAIKNNISFKSHYDHGIIRHIAAFYFWGYEDLQSKGLLSLIIDENNPNTILELVNFIWRQEKYINGLKEDEVKRFEKIIFELWTLLAIKYENTTTEEEQKVLIALSNLLELAPEINDEYTNLVLKSTKIPEKDFHTHYLIENLNKKKDKGDRNVTAKNIGIILNSIQFTPYFSSTDNKLIVDLVTFLYQNGQKPAANEFCNKMAKQGHEFLKDIYNKNQ
ncbi:MAG: hypothetical protein F9K09_03825 [Flavobacteriales bacterium]|nr:MAG: hypothetical protein F9K09_03825 [Flavobacteriales bacterium]